MALAAKRATGAKSLFDMRGFWADERVDGGLWPADGALYRAAKKVERRLLLNADHVVTLTHASVQELEKLPYLHGRMPPISVIPTCADLDKFTIQGPLQRDPFVLGYVGSVGTWYLLDDMLRCFRALQTELPDARLLFVNRREQPLIRQRVRQAGIDENNVEIVAAEHDDVPKLVGRMSAGMALIKPVYSKISSAPTKLAEYLGCGVPCLGNAGVGDVDYILESNRVGVALRGFSDGELIERSRQLIQLSQDPKIQRRCRSAACDLFSLESGVAKYEAIYRELDR
jgi:glycosyltransferase involved in cell wall biosynthesis